MELCGGGKTFLNYSVDFIFLSFGIIGFIVELWNCSRVTEEA